MSDYMGVMMSVIQFASRGVLVGLLAYAVTGCIAPPDEGEDTAARSESIAGEPEAGQAADDGSSLLRTIAPSCLSRDLNESDRLLQVENNCSTTQNVKVIIAFGPDFSCVSITPGHFRSFLWNSPGRFDSLVLC